MTMHHLSAEDISAFLDGECTETEFRAAQTHLDTCADCRKIADDQQFIKTLMGTMDEPELPRSFAITPELVDTTAPLSSPTIEPSTSPPKGKVVQFETFTKFLSIAAVLAFLVLGGAQMAGLGDQSETNNNQSVELTETNPMHNALEEQEPELARGEVREQGESAAANASPLNTTNANVDTQTQASDNGLTLLEITTIGVGMVALASIAGWILIHYRAGETSSNS